MRKSINKTTVIIVLALFLTLSVGYALFSDTITIEGTATAQGNFDITTTCSAGYSDDIIEISGGELSRDMDQIGFANSICNVNDDMVTMTTDLLYPGANRIFTIKMTNTGSIPAIIWGATIDRPIQSFDMESSASYFMKNIDDDSVISSGTGGYIYTTKGNEYFLYSALIVKIKDDGISLDNSVIYDKDKEVAGIKLNPGESLFVGPGFEYNQNFVSVLSDNGKSEYFEFKINHQFNWEQYTDNSNYEEADFYDFNFLNE